jgi:3',5'-cyclic AMP phosphodiesterase CpdA
MLHEDGEIAVLGISTPRALTGANGRISPRQLTDIRTVFEPMRDARWKILVSHHPLLSPPRRSDLPAVRGALRALDAITAVGVRVVLAGHYHQPFAAESGIENITARGGILLIQAGTATSTRLRGEPNSYNMIRFEPDAVICEPQLWNGQRFAPAKARRFRLTAGDGWTLDPPDAAG